ncbi:hypothetical protein INT45_001070, partial [Circinella minor]
MIGEALNSICTLSEKFQITTKTRNETLAKQYEFDYLGKQISEKPIGSIAHTGTIISAYKPFFNIPVRRQMEQKSFSFKRIQDLLTKYSLVYPMVRFALTSVGPSRGTKKWIQPSTSGVMNAIVAAYGSQLSNMLEHRFITTSDNQLSIECVLAKPNAGNIYILYKYPDIVYRGERIHVYINKRPVNYSKCDLKELVSLARKRFNDDVPPRKIPFIYISIQLQGDQLDVNIEPNKMAVMLHHKQDVLDLFEKLINQIYGSPMERLFGAVQQEDQIDCQRLDGKSAPFSSPNKLDNSPGRRIIPHKEHHEVTYHNTTDELENNANLLRLDSEEEEMLDMSSILSTTTTNMDIDIPDYSGRREEQQRTELSHQANKEKKQLFPAFNDDGTITGNDSNVWKFSMCSQETASSSSSSGNDQLVPSDDDDDLIISKEAPVSTLTGWLEKPRQHSHVQESTATNVSEITLPQPLQHDEQSFNRVFASSSSSLSTSTSTSIKSPPNNTIVTPPSTTPSPKQRSSVSLSSSNTDTQPFVDPVTRLSSNNSAQRENTSSPAIGSSSRSLPVSSPAKQTINSLTSKQSMRNLSPDTLLPIAEESLWQIDANYLDNQQEPTPMVMDSPKQQQQQQKKQTQIPPTNRKRTSPSLSPVPNDNRDLFDMFRMQSSKAQSVNTSSATLSPVKYSKADKGKNVVRLPIDVQDHPITTTSISPPDPLIRAQDQRHPQSLSPNNTTITTTTAAAATSTAANIIPRKRKRNTLFSDQHKKSSALFNTLNLEMPVKVNSSTLSTNYALQYQRLSRYHRTRLDHYQPGETTKSNDNIVVCQFPLLDRNMSGNSESLVVYTKQYHGVNVKEIGILDLDRMKFAGSLDLLLKRYELVCKTQLRHPIHIELSKEDPYFKIIQSLKSHESMLCDDDGQDHLYKVVTDRCIVTNGFECRWRMLDCNTMLLQIVSIHDLDGKENYDISDFRELLSIIQQTKGSDDDKDDLSKYRPTRLIDYFGRLSMDPENLPLVQGKKVLSDDYINGDDNHFLDWMEVNENGETYTVGVSDLLEEQRSI